MDRERLQEKFRGCKAGHTIGDALGMPAESMTTSEILAATDGIGVHGFLAPIQRRFWSTIRLRPGQFTDDTQLDNAIARSLVRKRSFDLEDIAAMHIAAYEGERRGWGKSTEIAIRELKDGKRRIGDPIIDPEALGMGNGVAMKVAALAMWLVNRPRDGEESRAHRHAALNRYVELVGSLTHRDPCAIIGGQLIAHAVRRALETELVAGTNPMVLETALASVRPRISCPYHGAVVFDACEIAVSGSRREIEQLILQKTSSDVHESIPFVFATVRQYLGSYRDGVLAAVNAGHDTDSNGAMVGAILGALHGIDAIPAEWLRDIESREELLALADALWIHALEV